MKKYRKDNVVIKADATLAKELLLQGYEEVKAQEKKPASKTQDKKEG